MPQGFDATRGTSCFPLASVPGFCLFGELFPDNERQAVLPTSFPQLRENPGPEGTGVEILAGQFRSSSLPVMISSRPGSSRASTWQSPILALA
jgi:hypothetical protein